MAKTKAGGGPFLAVLAGVGVIGAGVVAWIVVGSGGEQQAAAPMAKAAPPGLPSGRLKLLRTGVEASRYLALDDQKRVGNAVELTMLTVAKSPKGLPGGAGLLVERKQVKCSPQRVFDAWVANYDYQGGLVRQQGYALTRHGRPASPDEQELMQAICAPPPSAGAEVFDGYRGAQRDFQSIPEGFEAGDDAHAWAWLCADGARGGWRNSLPAECDKAVALNPASGQVRLDRAYMNLKRGRYAPAKADFDVVVAKEPDNPRALFGRGLALAALGDEPGGKADRGKALGIDPKILRWVEGTYLFTVGTGWRTA